jgi:hypothetical protein
MCSTIEQMNTINAFWVFVLPTELLFATFVSLAICLAFAARSTHTHEFSVIERCMIGAAVLTILFAATLFFAPVWKYGVVTVTVSLVAILAASARVRVLNGACIFLQVLALLYLFDFVHGNAYLGVPMSRTEQGIIDSSTMGVLHTTAKYFKSIADVSSQGNCVKYYRYFAWDPNVRDTRFDNPEVTTFGYCSRAWTVALYLFEGAVLDLVLLQMVLQILCLISRTKLYMLHHMGGSIAHNAIHHHGHHHHHGM